MTIGRRVVFLDRDGVLTVPLEREGKGYAARSRDELEFYPGAADSVSRLRRAGFDVVVVTNQPDLANGLIDRAELEAIHAEVMAKLGPLRIHTCPHLGVDNCGCRKPLPGMLFAEYEIEPVLFEESWLVGDRDSDIEAGLTVGCRVIFIDRGWSDETGSRAGKVVLSLAEAVDAILA